MLKGAFTRGGKAQRGVRAAERAGATGRAAGGGRRDRRHGQPGRARLVEGGELPAIPLVGFFSVAQLDESLGAVDLKLTAEQRNRLDTTW